MPALSYIVKQGFVVIMFRHLLVQRQHIIHDNGTIQAHHSLYVVYCIHLLLCIRCLLLLFVFYCCLFTLHVVYSYTILYDFLLVLFVYLFELL